MTVNLSLSHSQWDAAENLSSSIDLTNHLSSSGYGHPLHNRVIIAVALNFCVNGWLLCGVVFRFRKLRTHRNAVLLVAHLALVSSLASVVTLVNTKFVTELAGFGRHYCPIISYCKAVLGSIFWVNLIGITYERIRCIQEHERPFTLYFNIVRVWVIMGFLNLPSLFMSENVSDAESSCIPVLLLNSLFMTLSYEAFRLILHVAVFGYTIHAVLYIRSKLHYIYAVSPVASESMRRRIKTLRVVYYYLISLIVILLPGIIARFVLRVRILIQDEEETTSKASRVTKQLLTFTMFFSTILNPLILMILFDSNFFRSFMCCYSNSSNSEQDEGISHETHTGRGGHINSLPRNPLGNTSRASTFVKSSSLTTSETRGKESVSLSNAEMFARRERLI